MTFRRLFAVCIFSGQGPTWAPTSIRNLYAFEITEIVAQLEDGDDVVLDAYLVRIKETAL